MSKHKHKRKKTYAVEYGPDMKTALAPNVPFSGNKIQELDFSKEGSVGDLNDMERRRRLAIMLSAAKRAALPWCPECNVHKCLEGDNLCGICSKIAAEHGPRKILELHNSYCGACQRPVCQMCREKKARHGAKLCEGCEGEGDE